MNRDFADYAGKQDWAIEVIRGMINDKGDKIARSHTDAMDEAIDAALESEEDPGPLKDEGDLREGAHRANKALEAIKELESRNYQTVPVDPSLNLTEQIINFAKEEIGLELGDTSRRRAAANVFTNSK